MVAVGTPYGFRRVPGAGASVPQLSSPAARRVEMWSGALVENLTSFAGRTNPKLAKLEARRKVVDCGGRGLVIRRSPFSTSSVGSPAR